MQAIIFSFMLVGEGSHFHSLQKLLLQLAVLSIFLYTMKNIFTGFLLVHVVFCPF